jgi:predicted TIM-barrel fold metal-dependent hydrolase
VEVIKTNILIFSIMRQRHIFFLCILALSLAGCNRTGPLGNGTGSGPATDTISEDLSATLLLRDYRPQSIYHVPKTQVERAMYPVIDMHSHDYAGDDAGVKRWIANMDRVGIEKSIVMTEATGERFDSIMAVYAPYKDRFDVWCSFDYTGYDEPGFGPAAVAELERCVEQGAKGVGELGDKGKGLFYNRDAPAWGMHSDDPRMDPLFEKCAELGLPVNIHIAEPKWMYEPMDSTNDGLMEALYWQVEKEEGKLGHDELMTVLWNTLERHPETTFIACHYANCTYDLSIIAGMLDRFPNLYLDISARFFNVAAIPGNAAAFFDEYQDRLCYGTDMGTSEQMYRLTYRILETDDEHFYGSEYGLDSYHFPVYGLGLSNRVLEKIYRKNALKLSGS